MHDENTHLLFRSTPIKVIMDRPIMPRSRTRSFKRSTMNVKKVVAVASGKEHWEKHSSKFDSFHNIIWFVSHFNRPF